MVANTETIDVAVAVIYNSAGQLLITRRSDKQSHAGLWEFPGGKCHQSEQPALALVREIKEELGLIIHDASHFVTIGHDYEDKHVRLIFFKVKHYSGIPQLMENQTAMKWVNLSELSHYEFPKANQKVLPLLFPG